MDNDIVVDPSVPHAIEFYNHEVKVGTLDFIGNEIKFTGKADESADLFFNHFLKDLCDQYIAKNLKPNGG